MNQKLIAEYLRLCQEEKFPFYLDNLSEAKVVDIFNKLKTTELSQYNNVGLDLIRFFHPSIWYANKLNKLSPFDAWNNSIVLKQIIANRIKYKGENLSIKDIRSGFSASGIAPKVSIFKPTLARYLIYKYLNNFDVIFDPCSGYSARLLGAATLNKSYIGFDINDITISESIQLTEQLNIKNVKLYNKNSLYEKGSFDCLFTCPPYGNKENWNQDIEQLSANEWIDACISNFKCKQYLFVVDSPTKHEKNIVEKINNTSHFSKNQEVVILIK